MPGEDDFTSGNCLTFGERPCGLHQSYELIWCRSSNICEESCCFKSSLSQACGSSESWQFLPLPAEYHFLLDLSTVTNKKTSAWRVNSVQESWYDRCRQKQNEELNAWVVLSCFYADCMLEWVLNFQSSLFLSFCSKLCHIFIFSNCRSKTWIVIGRLQTHLKFLSTTRSLVLVRLV